MMGHAVYVSSALLDERLFKSVHIHQYFATCTVSNRRDFVLALVLHSECFI